MIENYSSKLLQRAVNEFSKLPGIGKKTALRLVLHQLRRSNEEVSQFANALTDLKANIRYCSKCHNISDSEICPICSDTHRDSRTLCVVENVKDVMSIENTHQYNGLYHVLGGIISPMDGIGPSDIELDSLEKRVASGSIDEIIMALSSTMEGDTTIYYISKRLENYNVKVTAIARGISVGDELEYTDEVTLGRAILNRVEIK